MRNHVGYYPNLPSSHRYNLQAAQQEWHEKELRMEPEVLDSGQLVIRVYGMDLRNYASLVGPMNAAEHRDFCATRHGGTREIIEPTMSERIVHLGKNLTALAAKKLSTLRT